MKKQLKIEIKKFRNWSKNYSKIPEPKRLGEWEIDYEDWIKIESLFEEFLDTESYKNWSDEDIKNILYLIARDNEMEDFINYIAEKQPDSFKLLA